MASERDISWGADCDVCETRLDAGRAERALNPEDGSVICGVCRDEARSEARIAELEARVATLTEERDAIVARFAQWWRIQRQAEGDMLAERARAEAAEREAATLRELLGAVANAAEYLAMRYGDTLAGRSVRDADEAFSGVEVTVERARAALAGAGRSTEG